MPGLKLGFDLGSDRMRICVGDRGLVSDEPLIAAVDAYTGDVLAFGEEAGKMNRRVPSSIEIKSFISGGRITDFELAEKVISGGMLPKIDGCVRALESGINKVHLIDGRILHTLLLEIFTDRGVGTQILRPDSI